MSRSRQFSHPLLLLCIDYEDCVPARDAYSKCLAQCGSVSELDFTTVGINTALPHHQHTIAVISAEKPALLENLR